MNPETELTITLTAQEINLIGQLFDAAIRANGLDAAKAALPLIDKITTQAVFPTTAAAINQPLEF
jgi:hypothetical protein